MKILLKTLLLGVLATPIGVSAAVYAINTKESTSLSSTISHDGDEYVMKQGDYTFTLNADDLKFKITKGDKTWTSSDVKEDDEKITGYRAAFYESPLTIYSYDTNGGENYFSIFDEDHEGSTIKRVTIDGNKLIANISTYDGKRKNPTLKVSLNIYYELIDDGLSLSVDDIEVDEESVNTISKLLIYPGFGMTYQQHDGYFLIPDGSGALIDLSKQTHAQSTMSSMIYGKDIGIAPNSETYYAADHLSMPMFSMYDNEKAMLATVEGGQEYSEFNCKAAGTIDDYNAMYFRFVYKELTYKYLGISEENRRIVPQEFANEFTPKVHYHLYDEKLDYSGIAHKYRQYLINNNLLNDEQYGDNNLRLEFLMADSKKALFGKELVKMTSTRFIKDKVEELSSSLENDLTVSLRGYTRGGFENSYPHMFPVEGATGNYGDLGEYLSTKNIQFNFNVDLVRSFERDGVADNLPQKSMNSRDWVNGTNIWFYRVTPNKTGELLNKYEPYIDKYSATGFDFTSIGNELFSTYYDDAVSRSGAIAKYQEIMSNYHHLSNMRKPNIYMFKYFSNYLDAPTSNSGYTIETESIPFLQMVLSGYKSFYSPALNLNYLGDKQLLQLVDYNVNPSFLLTEEETMDLIDSPASSYIYSSKYTAWEKDIIDAYNKVVKVLKQVEGSKFISREEISKNVYKNNYDNGVTIIINYSATPYIYGDKEVPAVSSEVFSV